MLGRAAAAGGWFWRCVIALLVTVVISCWWVNPCSFRRSGDSWSASWEAFGMALIGVIEYALSLREPLMGLMEMDGTGSHERQS